MKSIAHGELETQILKQIWVKKECSAREITDEINKKRGIALTTVSTILERLFEKGLVDRKKIGGRVKYLPKVSEEIYTTKIVKQFMNKIVNSFGEVAITSFVKGIKDLPVDKRKEVIRLLDKGKNK